VRNPILKVLTATAVVLAVASFSGGTFAQDKKAPAAKAPSACKGLAEAACKAKAECGWIAPKTGKQRPYCRTKAKRTSTKKKT
jgi:hypothetical protein